MSHISDPLFNGSLPAPFHELKQFLPQKSAYSRAELESIHVAFGTKTFNPNDYPQITVAKSGVPYVRQLDIEDGEDCSMLKVFAIDYSDCPLDVKLRIDQLKSHVQGIYAFDKPQSGFMRVKDLMSGNRDGPGTAFTTSLTLYNSWCVAPVAHSVEKEDADNRVPKWVKTFHILLGNLAQSAMPKFMSQEYIQFCNTRKTIVNSPCFGSSYDTQSYFSSAQVNCSNGEIHVGGKAGDVHTDTQDCKASYSMSVNLSVVRSSSNLGYFWFPNLDLIIPVKPQQIIIFQGIEEHTGTPLIIDKTDKSVLPLGYPNDVRFNIIAYPKAGIINGTSPRNLNSTISGAPKANLYQHALPHFGGELNYQIWMKVEMAKAIVEQATKSLSMIKDIKLDPQAIYNAITLPPYESTTGSQTSVSNIQFFHQVELERFHIRIKHVHGIVAKYLRKSFTAKINSSHLEKSGQSQERLGSYNSLASGIAVDNESHTFASRFPDEIDEADQYANIDPNLLAHDADLSRLTNSILGMPQDFIDTFKKHFATEALDAKIKTLVATKKTNTSLGKGVEKVIAVLPSLADLHNINPTATTDICMAYSNAMGVFYDKIMQGDFVIKGFRASFMKLWLEVFSIFNINRYNVWEIQNLSFAENSLSLKLRNMIDDAFTKWNDNPEAICIFEVTAAEFFGAQFNSKIHLDVKLMEASDRSTNTELNTNEIKAYIMLQTVWGLCMHKPISNFYSLFIPRKLNSIKIYKDRLGSSHNKSRQLMKNRFQFFWALLNHFNPNASELVLNGLLMLDEFYDFAFSYNPRDIIDLKLLSIFISQLNSDEEKERRSQILCLAATYNKVFDSSSLLTSRGSRQVSLYLLPQADCNLVEASSVTQKRKTVVGRITQDGNPASRQRLNHQLTFHPNVVPDSPAAQLNGYVLHLFEYLYQVAQVGKTIIAMRELMEAQNEKITNDRNPFLRDITDARLKQFMIRACNTTTNADKYISFRTKGPSFELIRSFYPSEASCRENLQQFLWHLFIWRTFGFGRLEVIRKLHSTTCIEEALDALNIFDNILSRGALVAFPVYGQFRIPTKKRLDILSSLHNLSEALSQRLSITAIPFSQAKDIIAEYKIPYVPATGIVAWLIICDLAEYSLCLSPTVEDLAIKIGQMPLDKGRQSGTGGSGLIEALFVIQEECEIEIPFKTDMQLRACLLQVFNAMYDTVGEDSRNIQGRDLSIADLEHMLCKVSREAKV